MRPPLTTTNPWGSKVSLPREGPIIAASCVQYSEPASVATALFLAVGVSLYLGGLAVFRWLIRGGTITVRVIMAVVALPTALVGLALSSLAQLSLLVVLLIVATIADSVHLPRLR
jgi:hypothetical protein